MKAQHLDRLISIQRAALGRDAANEVTEAWGLFIERFASKEDVKDSEKFGSGEVRAEITNRFVVRYDPETATIDTQDQLTHEGRVHEIIGVKEVGRAQWVEITTSRRSERRP